VLHPVRWHCVGVAALSLVLQRCTALCGRCSPLADIAEALHCSPFADIAAALVLQRFHWLCSGMQPIAALAVFSPLQQCWRCSSFGVAAVLALQRRGMQPYRWCSVILQALQQCAALLLALALHTVTTPLQGCSPFADVQPFCGGVAALSLALQRCAALLVAAASVLQ